MYKIDEIKMLRLGQRDENLARPLTFDCSDWLEQYPEASIHILFRRPGESAIVPISTTLEGTTLTWLIHDYEVGKTGIGNAEFRAVDTAGLRRKSRIIPCSIEETLLGDDETVLYTQDQVDETLAHISEAAQAAQAAKASEEAAALSASEAGESAASAGTAADVAVGARDAAQAAQTAAETAQHQAEAAQEGAEAAQSGVHADAEAAEQAKVAAQAAQAGAQGAASQASADRVAAETARTDAEAAATHAEAVVDGIDQAGADQVAAVNAAGHAQVSAVNQAGTTQVGNVNAAGTTQVNAVQAKGTQVIASIPADYSQMSTDVTNLKSATNAIANSNPAIPIIYISGSINSEGNASGENTRIRIQTTSMPQIKSGDYVYIDDAYKVVVRLFNTQEVGSSAYYGVAGGQSVFKNGVIPLGEYVGKYANIVIQKVGAESTDISGYIADIPNHVKYVSFDDGINRLISEIVKDKLLTRSKALKNLLYKAAYSEVLQDEFYNFQIAYGLNLMEGTVIGKTLGVATNVMQYTYSANSYGVAIPIIGGMRYTVRKNASNAFRIAVSEQEPASNGAVTATEVDHSGTELTITAGSTDNWLLVIYGIKNSTYTDAVLQEIYDSIVVLES